MQWKGFDRRYCCSIIAQYAVCCLAEAVEEPLMSAGGQAASKTGGLGGHKPDYYLSTIHVYITTSSTSRPPILQIFIKVHSSTTFARENKATKT
jgi:hypothetical protein